MSKSQMDLRNTRRPYVVYWNSIPSPYMVERFNALADRDTFEFEAWFNDRSHVDRSWHVDEANWHFRYRFMPCTKLFGRRLHWPLLLLGRRPDVLVSLYAAPAFVVGWFLAKTRGTKTGFRVLVTYERWVSRNFVKDAIKRFLFRRVDVVETPGEDGKQFAIRYGVPPERIFFATHTVDIAYLQSKVSAARQQKNCLRKVLGLDGVTFIYVGRLWWGKGVQYLLEAFEMVQDQSDEPVSLLLVGDGDEEEELKENCRIKGIVNVAFAGFQQKADLPRYYAAADVFVFPTLGDPYGLVVDEAMACSLPIISTSAAGEIRTRVEEGVNGYIVPPGSSLELAGRMLHLVKNPDLRESMGKISAERVADHTPEKWAQDFENIVEHLLRSK